MNQPVSPRLTLIGAGPGDPDLITVKGLKKLAEADVVLYDALIDTALLKYAPAASIKVFVGKRSGAHRFSQDEINRMIVRYAMKYGHVVRLKGGDPYVYGRGFEEFAFAASHHIPVEVVPGISSATGLTASLGIPLTLRGVNESFWVVTGTASEGKFSKDLVLAARSNATVIILMGMKKLAEIVRVYQSLFKNQQAITIIQNGTMPDEKQVTGTIDTIQELAGEKGLSSPAVIVIGEVIERSIEVAEENRNRLRGLSAIRTTRKKGSFSKVTNGN